MNRLLNTQEAAKATGLSAYELRMGFKQGRYPAIEIGDEDSRVKRLRWNLDALEAAILRQLGYCGGGAADSVALEASEALKDSAVPENSTAPAD